MCVATHHWKFLAQNIRRRSKHASDWILLPFSEFVTHNTDPSRTQTTIWRTCPELLRGFYLITAMKIIDNYTRVIPDPSCKCAQADVLVVHFEYRHIASLQTKPVWWHVLHICFPNPLTCLPSSLWQWCEKVMYILPLTNLDTHFTGRLHCGSIHSCEWVAMGSAKAALLAAVA